MVNATLFMQHDTDKLDALKTIFWQVSDPDHPNRGQYLTAKEVTVPTRSPILYVSSCSAWTVDSSLWVHLLGPLSTF